jgi:hypothetical protein
MKSYVLFCLLIGFGTLPLTAGYHPIEFQCRGLEAYEIRGTHDVDWVWGTIRSKSGNVTIGFTIGLPVRQEVPAERPPGFRTYKIERIGRVLFRYGLNVRENLMKATLIGAPMDLQVNLVAHPRSKEEFMAVARTLATAPCTGKIDHR